MLKKLMTFGLLAAVAAGVWNWTRVVAVSEKVRDSWIESQNHQALEDWDVHFKREMRKLKGQVEKLEKNGNEADLKAEVAAIKAERVAVQLASSERLISAFKARLAATRDADNFVFAGQHYDDGTAALQLKRFEAEYKALQTRKATAEAEMKTNRETAKAVRKAAKALQAKAQKLSEQGQALALRRQVLRTQKQLREAEARQQELVRLDTEPLDTLEALCRTAEAELDRAEARARIREQKAPQKTMSLDEGLILEGQQF